MCMLILALGEECATEGDVRLAGGNGENEGRVEVCLAGEWGTICDRGWGVNDATVICRQLGLVNSTTGKQFALVLTFLLSTVLYNTVADFLYRFSPGSGPIHYSGLQCSGNETHILQCSAQNAFSEVQCGHKRDVAVKCLSGEQ